MEEVMAEIDIQKKRKSPWPWILGGLAAALALWGIAKVAERPQRDIAETVEERVPPPAEMPRTERPTAEARTREMGGVERYASTVAGMATVEASQLNTYVGGALGQLGTVLHSLAAGTPHEAAVGKHLDGLRKATDEIQQTPFTEDTKANTVKSAFKSASSAMSELRKGQPDKKELGTQTKAVSDAADAIKGDQPVLDQRSGLQRFFTASATALKGLAGDEQPSGAQPTPGAEQPSGAEQPPGGQQPSGAQPTPGADATQDAQPTPGADQPTGGQQQR